MGVQPIFPFVGHRLILSLALKHWPLSGWGYGLAPFRLGIWTGPFLVGDMALVCVYWFDCRVRLECFIMWDWEPLSSISLIRLFLAALKKHGFTPKHRAFGF